MISWNVEYFLSNSWKCRVNHVRDCTIIGGAWNEINFKY